MNKYKVLVSESVAGRIREVGEIVELSAEEAQPLVENGTLALESVEVADQGAVKDGGEGTGEGTGVGAAGEEEKKDEQ